MRAAADRATGREKSNRAVGLGCAAAVVLFGLLILGIYDDLHTKGMPGLKAEFDNLAIVGGAALMMAAIGYTTERRTKK